MEGQPVSVEVLFKYLLESRSKFPRRVSAVRTFVDFQDAERPLVLARVRTRVTLQHGATPVATAAMVDAPRPDTTQAASSVVRRAVLPVLHMVRIGTAGELLLLTTLWQGRRRRPP